MFKESNGYEKAMPSNCRITSTHSTVVEN